MEVARLLVKVGADIGDALKGLDNVSDKLRNYGQELQDAGLRMTAGLTAPLAGAGLAVFNLGSDFESAFAGVRKTVDATEEQLAGLRQGIRDMAMDLPASAVEIAGVAEAAGQLGIKTDAIMGFTRTMVDLGVATNLTGEQAATALARFANITQMPQDQFDRLGATVVDLGNNLATTEAEIVSMGLRLAGAGAQVGLSEAQILGFAGALSSVGIEAEAGGSAVSRVMIDVAKAVANGGKKLDSFAAVAGMSSQQFAQAFKEDASGAIITFIEGLGRMGDEGENVFSVLDSLSLGEIRVRDALLRASGAGDLFRESVAIGSKAWEENIALTKEAEQRYATVESRLGILRNRASDVAITLYDQMRPVIVELLGRVTGLVDGIGVLAGNLAQMDPNLRNAALAFAAVLAAAGPLTLALGGMATAAGFLLSPLGAIVVATGLLAAAWAADLGGMQDKAASAFNDISARAQEMGIGLGTVFQTAALAAATYAVIVATRLVAATASAAAASARLVASLTAQVVQFGLAGAAAAAAAAKQIFFAASGLGSIIAQVPWFLANLGFIITYYGTVAAAAVRSAVMQAAAWLGTVVPAIVSAAAAGLAALAPFALGVAAIAAVVAGVAVAWANNWGDIQGITGRVLSWIGDRIADFINWLSSLPLIGDKVKEMWAGATGAIQGFTAGVGPAVSAAVDTGRNLIDEFVNGFPSLQSQVSNLMKPSPASAADLDIAKQSGEDIAAEFKKGLAEATAGGLGDIGGAASGGGGSSGGGSSGDEGTGLSEFVIGQLGALLDPAQMAGEEIGESVANGLIEGLEGMADRITEQYGQAVAALRDAGMDEAADAVEGFSSQADEALRGTAAELLKVGEGAAEQAALGLTAEMVEEWRKNEEARLIKELAEKLGGIEEEFTKQLPKSLAEHQDLLMGLYGEVSRRVRVAAGLSELPEEEKPKRKRSTQTPLPEGGDSLSGLQPVNITINIDGEALFMPLLGQPKVVSEIDRALKKHKLLQVERG